MKAISLWQPWALLWALQIKKYETRSWATNYRGPIAIHAAIKNPETIFIEPNTIWEMRKALNVDSFKELPFGSIIATADLVDCLYIVNHPGVNVDIAKHIQIGAESMINDKHHPEFGKYIVPTEQEILFGDWTPGRYAWEVENVQMLPEPVPAKGKQKLWEWKNE